MMSIKLCVPVVIVILFSLILREAEGIAFDKSKNLKGVNTFRITEEDHLQMSAGSPEFCHKLDCPSFSVINKTADYEERLYQKSNWISTKMEGDDFTGSQPKMFKKLFKYIQGGNAKGEKIAMTAPVITHVIPGQGPTCGDKFVMSFFMSPNVTHPPQPTDVLVYLSTLPPQKVFVSSFGGHADDSDWLYNAINLSAALNVTGKKFNKDFFYTAGYDSPLTFFGRHNEVWILAE